MELKDFLDAIGAVIRCNLLLQVKFFMEHLMYLLGDGQLFNSLLLFGKVFQVVAYFQSILEWSESQITGVSELGLLLSHLVKGARFLEQFEVTLQSYVFLVNMR